MGVDRSPVRVNIFLFFCESLCNRDGLVSSKFCFSPMLPACSSAGGRHPMQCTYWLQRGATAYCTTLDCTTPAGYSGQSLVAICTSSGSDIHQKKDVGYNKNFPRWRSSIFMVRVSGGVTGPLRAGESVQFGPSCWERAQHRYESAHYSVRAATRSSGFCFLNILYFGYFLCQPVNQYWSD